MAKANAEAFARFLVERYGKKDGYILGATGQDPKKWSVGSWWFAQYKSNPKQYQKALYWRETAERVWDCQGLAEGYVKDVTGQNVNTKARFAYRDWCPADKKGEGLIPTKWRVPGAAVYWGATAATISHVAFLIEPVKEGEPDGDWWMVEARSVLLGVCKTKLKARNPQYWGWMEKHFEYGEPVPVVPDPDGCPYKRPTRIVKRGMKGDDVRWVQWHLDRIDPRLLPRYGVDGSFGKETETAVRAYQSMRDLKVDGKVGPQTIGALVDDVEQLEADEIWEEYKPSQETEIDPDAPEETDPDADWEQYLDQDGMAALPPDEAREVAEELARSEREGT